jgi:hypothetical protein
VIALGATQVYANDISSSSSSSGGCFPPSLVPELVAVLFQNAPEDERQCRNYCSQFRKACTSAVRAHKRCLQDIFREVTDSEIITECADLSGGEKRSCKRSNQNDFRSFRQFLSDERTAGVDECEGRFQSCRESCSGRDD